MADAMKQKPKLKTHPVKEVLGHDESLALCASLRADAALAALEFMKRPVRSTFAEFDVAMSKAIELLRAARTQQQIHRTLFNGDGSTRRIQVIQEASNAVDTATDVPG